MVLPDEASTDFRNLFEYWLQISPSGRLPGRQHFDPVDVPSLLPNLWLMDVHREPFRFRHRLVGSFIDACAGESLTGQWFAQELEGERLRLALEDLEHVVTSKQANWRRGKPVIQWERQDIELERLYLPLAKDGETVDMILAMTKYTELPSDKSPPMTQHA